MEVDVDNVWKHDTKTMEHGQWTEKMEVALIACMQVVVRIDNSFDCLSNYDRLEKLYTLLLPSCKKLGS